MRPLEGVIEAMSEFEGCSDPMAYFTRGHVDKREFASEVVIYCAELMKWPEWYDSFPYTADDVEYVYYRNVPIGRDFPGMTVMRPCGGPGRGAYPVTQIDIERVCVRRPAKEA